MIHMNQTELNWQRLMSECFDSVWRVKGHGSSARDVLQSRPMTHLNRSLRRTYYYIDRPDIGGRVVRVRETSNPLSRIPK